MSEQGKCAGGYELPGMGKPCKKCGATSREPCPEFARQQADEIASLRAQLASASRELADAKSNVAYLSNAAETAFRDRDYYSAQLARAREALNALCDIIEEDELHGGGADETDCPICETMRAARAAALTDEKGKS